MKPVQQVFRRFRWLALALLILSCVTLWRACFTSKNKTDPDLGLYWNVSRLLPDEVGFESRDFMFYSNAPVNHWELRLWKILPKSNPEVVWRRPYELPVLITHSNPPEGSTILIRGANHDKVQLSSSMGEITRVLLSGKSRITRGHNTVVILSIPDGNAKPPPEVNEELKFADDVRPEDLTEICKRFGVELFAFELSRLPTGED